MKAIFIPPIEEKVFHSILTPYVRWDEWKMSRFCFLSRKEVMVVDFYNNYFSKKGEKIEPDPALDGKSESYKRIIEKALHKLEMHFEYYERWSL